MTKIKSSEELLDLSKKVKQQIDATNVRVLVCSGTGCIASGAKGVYEKLNLLSKADSTLEVVFAPEVAHPELKLPVSNKNVALTKSGCQGFCDIGPLVRIEPEGIVYTKVSIDDCEEILEKTIKNGEIIDRLLYEIDGEKCLTQKEIPFYKNQTRLVLEYCGNIDPENIFEAISAGAYQALTKALFTMTPQQVVDEISNSNLRGRGGGGFPTGRKWQQVANHDGEKFIICNGDEGDPGAFMDEGIMEGDPHRMIEGMLIAAYACDAREGYIYVRAEYPRAISRLKTAIEQASELGLIGENIMGTNFSFNLHINRGAGAFVCGEGSALTSSIEGQRGMPRIKPPRTTDKGLFGKPTVLNNVETFANVPVIINRGAAFYKGIGPENSPGTKAFSLTGCIKNTGLIEVPMGTKLKDVIFGIGGGIRGKASFKAVQIGGPSGGCLTNDHMEVPLDFDSLKGVGAMIGSGGLVVMDNNTCMVEVARFFMNFTQNESCGKCIPCRQGTKRILEILERIVAGKGRIEDLQQIEQLAGVIKNTALCGLGKTATQPVMSTIRHFREEYIEHIVHKRCPAHICGALAEYTIDNKICKKCSKCQRDCPAGAISGGKDAPYSINQEKCIKCGACEETCPFGAISAR